MKLNYSKKRFAALGLSGLAATSLLATGSGLTNVSFVTDSKAAPVKQTAARYSAKKVSSNKSDSDISKEETVYGNLDANGNVKETIVSDWLKNAGTNGTLKDSSDLSDITNVKGDETFSQDNKTLTWNTKDDDIYYQGTSTKELPVSMHITYSLDGKKMKADDLAGKSGKLTMKISYTNSSKNYVPFLMATGMILPTDTFQNITIDNGSVLASEGDNQIVVGYGVPGLKDALNLSTLNTKDISFPTDKLDDKLTDTVTLTADVTNFKMGATYTVASAEPFEELDLSDVSDTSDLDGKLDDLKDAATQLIDGTTDLSDGADKLVKNFKTYKKGVTTVKDGVSSLKKGAKTLSTGVKSYTSGADQLLSGVNTYTNGVDTLGTNVNSYADGVNQLVTAQGTYSDAVKNFPTQYETFRQGLNTFLSTVTTELSPEKCATYAAGTKQLVDGMATLHAGAVSLSSGLDTINQTVKQLEGNDTTNALLAGLKQMEAGYQAQLATITDPTAKAQVTAQLTAISGAIQYIEGAQKAAAAIDVATNGTSDGALDKNGTKDLKAGISGIVNATDADTGAMGKGVATLNDTISALSQKSSSLSTASAQLSSASDTIAAGISSAATNSAALYQAGTKITSNNAALTGGVSKLKSSSKTIRKNSKKLTKNSKTLQKGAKALFTGSKKLYTGTSQLDENAPKLLNGMKELAKGSHTLEEGMITFNDEGIVTLTGSLRDLIDSGNSLKTRLENLSNAAKEYQSFSGIDDSMAGSVKFIFATQEIKEKD